MMNGIFVVKKFPGSAGLAGRIYLAAMLVCAACVVRVQVGTLDTGVFAGRAHAQEQQSAIKDIELRAGERGLILTVYGSGPIALGGQADALEKATARYAEIRVKISKARSALGGDGVFTPPDELPVKEISVKEDAGGVDLAIKMRKTANGPVQVRGSGNQVRVLLTKDSQPDMVWTSSKGIIPSAKPAASAAAPEAELALGNIRVVERDNSAALYFDLSGSPAASLSKGGDSLVIVFANTALNPKLGTRVYNISGSSAYGSVRVFQGSGADNKNSVTAVVKLKLQGVSPVTADEEKRYVVRVTGGSQGKVFLWSVLEGVQSSETMADIKTEPVDMKKMEARAARDTQPFAGDQTFSVKDGPPKQAAPAPQTAPAKPAASAQPVPAQPAPAKPAQPVAKQVIPSKPEVPTASPDEEFHDSESAKQRPEDDLVRYKIYGRDPFIPLVKDPDPDSELPRVENLRLVGVLEDSREKIALLEDFTNSNRAFALRVNDPVEYGKVLRVHRDKVVFLIRDFDVSRSYTLSLSKDAKQGGKAGKK